MPIPAATGTLPKSDIPTLLFVGRLTPSKRVEHALQAFAVVKSSLPNARLWIIGRADDPAYERRLREAAQRIAGVEFLGRLPDDERQRRMAAAHLVIVTSVREGWGLVVTEANAAGTPAAGYDVPGLRDSIKPGLGVLTPAGDPAALGARAVELLGDAPVLAEMSRLARRDAGQYNWNRTYAEFVAALNDLMPGLRI